LKEKCTLENQFLSCVVDTEVESSVPEDTRNGDHQSSIEPLDPFLGVGLFQTIPQPLKLPVIQLPPNINSDSGPCEIQRMDENRCTATGHSTAQDIEP